LFHGISRDYLSISLAAYDSLYFVAGLQNADYDVATEAIKYMEQTEINILKDYSYYERNTSKEGPGNDSEGSHVCRPYVWKNNVFCPKRKP
jgi:hypothetical protein